MIQKFISGLSGTGKKLLAVAVIIFIIVLFDRLLFSPTLSRLSTIDEQIANEENSIRHDIRFLNSKDKILTENQPFEAYLTQEMLSEDEMTAAFLKKIEILANKSNVTIIKITPSASKKEDKFIKYQADLECSGQLQDMVSFMHLIETSKDLMKVIKYNLGSKKSETDEVKATMSVMRIVVPVKDQPTATADAVGVESEVSAQE